MLPLGNCNLIPLELRKELRVMRRGYKLSRFLRMFNEVNLHPRVDINSLIL